MITASGSNQLCLQSMLVVGLLTGCAGPSISDGPGPRQISLAEFSSTSAENPGGTTSSDPATASGHHEQSLEEETIPKPVRLGAGSSDLQERVDAIIADRENTRRGLRLNVPGDVILVDSLIGQINGRPIFADDILLPIEDQLIAESRNFATAREYAIRVEPIVFGRMRAMVLNELFLAEAESSLSTEQQKGLLYFMRNLRQEEVAKRGGSAAQAERELIDDEGISLDEYLERSKDAELIRAMVLGKIRSRVIVSRRDIEREYEKHYDEFNPQPVVTLSRIRLSSTQAELIEDVKNRLAAGESFAEVADSVGMREGGLWDTFPMGKGGITDIEINEAYLPYLENLGVGDTTEPITDARGRTLWLHVSLIDQPQGRSLYDPQVQRMLENKIYLERMNTERARFINELLEKSTLDDLSEMSERVLAIAILRYGP